MTTVRWELLKLFRSIKNYILNDLANRQGYTSKLIDPHRLLRRNPNIDHSVQYYYKIKKTYKPHDGFPAYVNGKKVKCWKLVATDDWGPEYYNYVPIFHKKMKRKTKTT